MNLLRAFEAVFNGSVYRHRSSTVGDRLSLSVFEDLYDIRRSLSYVDGVHERRLVVNTTNKVTGRKLRRGDGTFGERVISVDPAYAKDFSVWRGPTADVRIGVEVKIIATTMVAQIDRVIGDLRKQADQFRATTPKSISIALVGANYADSYRSYEGDRTYDKPGPKGAAPAAEADSAVARLLDGSSGAASAFDEFLVVKFKATNKPPFPFEWVEYSATLDHYLAVLQRVSRAYENRF